MSLPHLILGLLDMSPMSGYDLNKNFQSTIQHFWNTDQSQIYRALHRMLADGWLNVQEVIQSDSPNKKIYHVTEIGRAELRRWMNSPLEEHPVREAWLGRFFFAEHITDEALITLLREGEAALHTRYIVLRQLKDTLLREGEGQPPSRGDQLRMLTLDYGLEVHEFHITWLQKARQRIEAIDSGGAV
jgi:DNA-binding PadR family transcriptional regulator